MHCDELPLPHAILCRSTKISPDDMIERFRVLRTHKIRGWEALLSYYVLVPVLLEQFRNSFDPEDHEQANALLEASEPMLAACRDLRFGITKLQKRAQKIVREQAPIVAAHFATWDKDHKFFDLWIRDLQAIFAGNRATTLGDACRTTRTQWRRGSTALQRHLERACEAGRAYMKLHGDLVVANLRLVASTVKRGIYRACSPEDLGSEGVIGLITAVHRFDPQRGLRFATFGVYWIRHYVMRRQQCDDLVRLPVHVQEKCNRISRARRQFYAENGSEPSVTELLTSVNADCAIKARIGHAELVRLDRRASMVMSMHHPVGLFEDDDSTLQDVLPDHTISIEHEIAIEELKDVCERALATMDPAVADAFRQVSGMNEDETLQSVGAKHGLSRERIRQLSLEAIDQIRRTLRRRRVHFIFGKGGGVGVGTGGGREIGGP